MAGNLETAKKMLSKWRLTKKYRFFQYFFFWKFRIFNFLSLSRCKMMMTRKMHGKFQIDRVDLKF